jgi:hypothetical protein
MQGHTMSFFDKLLGTTGSAAVTLDEREAFTAVLLAASQARQWLSAEQGRSFSAC